MAILTPQVMEGVIWIAFAVIAASVVARMVMPLFAGRARPSERGPQVEIAAPPPLPRPSPFGAGRLLATTLVAVIALVQRGHASTAAQARHPSDPV